MKFAQLARTLQEQHGPHAREIDANHWAFEVMTADQRSQVVHLLLKEDHPGGPEAARLVAHSPIGPLPARYDLETLLRHNARLDVGAICIEDLRDEQNDQVPYLTLRASHLVATADYEEVWEMIEKVARVADGLEKQIFVQDTF